MSISGAFLFCCAYGGYLGRYAAYTYLYYSNRKRIPHLLHPRDLSEYLLSSMTKKSFLNYAKYADKVAVRDYVASQGLKDHLLDVYGVWKSAEDIDFDTLPGKFVLKANNGCGGHFICYDKAEIKDFDALRKRLNKSLVLGRNFNFEPHYKKIPPRIYAEELIETPDHTMPTDYKFMCINGKIGDCLVIEGRSSGQHFCRRYDENWQLLPYTADRFAVKEPLPKPKHWDEMCEIAKTLSKDFKCVRVDLYEYKDRVYFGELTFSPAGGVLPSYNDFAITELGKLFVGKP